MIFWEASGSNIPWVGIITNDADHFGVVAAQRTAKQGHAEQRDIETMELLLPHYQEAFKLSLKLQTIKAERQTLRDALAWLEDGALLLQADGTIEYANDAAVNMAKTQDGFGIARNALRISDLDQNKDFAQALAQSVALDAEKVTLTASMDFAVGRPSGKPPYIFSLRPLQDEQLAYDGSRPPCAILFIHDPLRSVSGDWQQLARHFGLTPAEAHLAVALQKGETLQSYATRQDLSMNTVYTHFGNLKDKTGCERIDQLIRLLTDFATCSAQQLNIRAAASSTIPATVTAPEMAPSGMRQRSRSAPCDP